MADKNKKNKSVDKEDNKSSVKKEIMSWVTSFAGAIVLAVILSQFIIMSVVVPSGSMEDTIMTDDRLIGFRFSYWFSQPQRGDIIIFKSPVEDTRLIKRVIGLPGETVKISDGKIYIDDSEQPLKENYLREEWEWENDGYTFNVPENCYFVMGDNRNDSLDARFWADEAIAYGIAHSEEEAKQYSYVNSESIQAKAIFKYFRSFALLAGDADYE